MFDVMIIGAGTAGMTAGIYAARAGLSACVLERVFAGGQISQTHMLENYPGFPEGVSGMEFAEAVRVQTERFGIKIDSADIESAELSGEIKRVFAADKVYEGRSVILGLGAKPAKLGVPGEDKFAGQGISYCATCDGAFFKKRTVAVVGGGDTALEDALYVSNIAAKVYIIHRRDQFRAQRLLVERASARENIEFIMDSVPEEFIGGLDFEGVRLKNKKTGEIRELALDGCFMAVGYKPDTAWLPPELKTDEKGYIIAGEDCRTNIAGVYAAGDVRTKKLRQVVTAAADGAVAATMAYEYINK